MKKNLLNKLWLRVGMIVAIMTTALSGTAWADTAASFSRSGTSNTTTGGTFSTSFSAKTGYYQDNNGDCYMQILSNSAYWTTTPASISLAAKIGGGSGNTDLTDPVYVVLLDNDGNEISSTKTSVTSHITTNTGDDYNISIPVANNVYGVKISHNKQSGFNVRYYSFRLSYTTSGGGTPTPTTYTVTYDANGGSGTMTDANSPYEEDDVVTLLTNTFTAPEGKLWNSWLVKDASNNTISVSNNQFTMPASNVTVTAQWVDDPDVPQYEWVLTDWSELQEDDVFVIVGNGTKAMDNSVVGSNPSALTVTTQNGKITSTVTNAMMWNRSAVDGGYKLLPNGSTEYWLYNSSGTNLRVYSSNSNSTFTYVTYSNKNYLQVGDRYVCIYNNSDWRAYKSSNIVETNTTFYKRQVVSNDPTIMASNVQLDYDATSGSFDFTINKPVTGGVTSVSENVDWISNATVSGNTVTFTTTANEATTSREGVITVTYTYNTKTVTADVTITQAAAPETYDWVATSLADLTEDDIFVIVGDNGDTFAMSNNNGTSGAPTAVAVTVSGNYITSQVPETIRWTISGNATNGYTFYPNGDTEKWLYCINDNNGVRVGTNANKTFTVYNGYLKHAETSRYVGIYKSQDWRCYTSINSNIEGQTFTFYKYVGAPLPAITAEDVEIAYNATSGSISYEVENPVAGGTLTASTEDAWLTLGAVSAAAVSFTTTENDAQPNRTASVMLTYTYGTETATKTITVTQTGNPDVKGGANNPYTVTEALAVISSLEDGGKTESRVYTKGVITDIEEVELEQYFNATYTISDETNDLMVYHGKYIDNANFTSADQIHEGDVVVIYGQLQKYVKEGVTTPEIASGNYIVSQAQTVTVSGAGYATFVAKGALEIPADVEVFAVTVNDGAASAHLNPITDGIPVGEAVLVRANAGTYEFPYTAETVAEISNNDLKAATVAFKPSAANTIYCLAKKGDPAKVGFYPVATTVTIPENKAYLDLSTIGGVKAFYGFEEDDPTGIDNLNANVNANEGAIYNLSGQMVNGKLPKGIYIVNGKKILK